MSLEVLTRPSSHSESLVSRLENHKKLIEESISQYLTGLKERAQNPALEKLVSCMTYSLESGGSRLRPLLAILTAEALGSPIKRVLPLGCAVELIHNYSLIHDDLPSMDNDDFRRGQPATHKAFGEAFAILSGDAIATEAFLILARGYQENPKLALELIQQLAEMSGPFGLVGGQAMDLEMRQQAVTQSQIEDLHRRKTGSLLKFSVLASAKVSEAGPTRFQALEKYADALGLVFQIADDIKDGERKDEVSLVTTLGFHGAQSKCENLILEACQAVDVLGPPSQGLKYLIDYIYKRSLS